MEAFNPTRLYSTGLFERNSGLFRHHSLQNLAVPQGRIILINLMTREASIRLRSANRTTLHFGLLTIAVKGLHRTGLGTKALLVLIDNRFSNLDQAIIGTMEIDLNNNIGVAYIARQNFSLSVNDICRHGTLQIQTLGYENLLGKTWP